MNRDATKSLHDYVTSEFAMIVPLLISIVALTTLSLNYWVAEKLKHLILTSKDGKFLMRWPPILLTINKRPEHTISTICKFYST